MAMKNQGGDDGRPGSKRAAVALWRGTGHVVWAMEDFGVAAIILADQKLLFVKADGVLVLAKPSPRGFQKLAEKKIAAETLRALPALANGRWRCEMHRRCTATESAKPINNTS
ncbi:MAG: hypothetical protein QF408_07115 [Pirellulales bacterium]|jgi:hypothetical protein|nr:hypothetical protein [Pirellulales bacterium]